MAFTLLYVYCQGGCRPDMEVATEWATPWVPREGWGPGGLCRGRAGGGAGLRPSPEMLLRKMGAARRPGSVYICVFSCIFAYLFVYLLLGSATVPEAGGGFPIPPGGEDNNPGVPAVILTREASPGDFSLLPVGAGCYRRKQ